MHFIEYSRAKKSKSPQRELIVFFAIGNNSNSFFHLETIISSHDVLLVISMKESEPISHKNTQFKANYPLDDAFFILETTMVVIISFFTEEMILTFSQGPCQTSLKSQFYNDLFRLQS